MEYRVKIAKQIGVIGGDVYQWDSGRKLEIIPKSGVTVDVVHFSNGDVVLPSIKGDVATVAIPNILLQEANPVTVYPVMILEDGTRTIFDFTFKVKKKQKPNDYVYTEIEVYTIKTAVDKALLEAKESGEFDGKDGKDGVNGKDGEDGADGYTPKKGIDYYTEADKAEMVNEVLSALPNGDGVSY